MRVARGLALWNLAELKRLLRARILQHTIFCHSFLSIGTNTLALRSMSWYRTSKKLPALILMYAPLLVCHCLLPIPSTSNFSWFFLVNICFQLFQGSLFFVRVLGNGRHSLIIVNVLVFFSLSVIVILCQRQRVVCILPALLFFFFVFVCVYVI